MWRRAFDAVEQNVSPQVEQWVRTDQFADMAAVMQRLQTQAQKRSERALRQTWHFWNLPAGSDVKRLSDRIAALERRVRDLQNQLEEQGGSTNGKPAQSSRARGTRQT
jgi:hypothetical protein